MVRTRSRLIWNISYWSILVSITILWRLIYAYWSPLVNRFLVPPGDDPIFHTAQVDAILSGRWAFFVDGYPLGFHYLTAAIGRLFGTDTITTIRIVVPLFLILPILAIYVCGSILFRSRSVGAAAATSYGLFAHAPLFLFGDGGYPNLFAGQILLPLALGWTISAIRQPTFKTIGLAVILAGMIPFVHHLSTVYLGLALLPLAVSLAFRLVRQSRWRALPLLLLGLGGMCLAGVGLWFLYRPILNEIFSSLKNSGTFAQFFGQAAVGALPPWSVFVTWQGWLFLLLGAAGFLALMIRSQDRLMKGWLLAWTCLMLAIGFLPELVINQRFLRELVLPLSLAAGFGLAELMAAAGRLRFGHVVVTLGILGAATAFQLAKAGDIFGLPAPYEYITRVGVDEAPAFPILKAITPPGGVIVANNGNFYLPYLVDRSIFFVTEPRLINYLPDGVTTLFLAARPPNVDPETGPVQYRRLEEITALLETMPNFELVAHFPSGSRIYRRIQTEGETS